MDFQAIRQDGLCVGRGYCQGPTTSVGLKEEVCRWMRQTANTELWDEVDGKKSRPATLQVIAGVGAARVAAMLQP